MMAVKASGDRVAADMAPPNYRSAVQIIRHGIVKLKNQIQGVNKTIGEKWGQVEGFKVNRKAGVVFAALDKLEAEERTDVLRSLNGLIDAAGWDETAQDLVDVAEDNVVHLRVHGAGEPEGDAEPNERGEDPDMAAAAAAVTGDDAPSGDDFEMTAEELARQTGRTPPAEEPEPAPPANPVAEAASRRRRKLSAEAGGEPYTGDNSDLAGE